jgi:hypothetical protein
MNSKEIEILLKKYDQGETSLKEEHTLREYFRKNQVPDHLQPWKAMFGYFTEDATAKVSERFEFVPPASEEEKQGKIISIESRRKQRLYALSLAASIVVVVALTLMFSLGVFTSAQPYGTITDPNLAYIETHNALKKVSDKFNLGMAEAQNIQTLNKGVDGMRKLGQFNNGINNARKLKQFNKYQPIKINQDNN